MKTKKIYLLTHLKIDVYQMIYEVGSRNGVGSKADCLTIMEIFLLKSPIKII